MFQFYVGVFLHLCTFYTLEDLHHFTSKMHNMQHLHQPFGKLPTKWAF